ncbi:hypothetical protein [Paraflavitalea pollutisoli]|uniref:hypothetical protein n=1 Tax=Paraflavitalea pollutisoli TaxID=3034143 RepID=UPI0023EE1202|nr:hypothetical protein [Paraflavitalea sp. H1-2-19X]
MSETIVITVPYRGTDKEIELEWQPMGYTHRFKAQIDNVEVYFEPDEERNYRVVLPPDVLDSHAKINVELVQAVATVLQETLS